MNSITEEEDIQNSKEEIEEPGAEPPNSEQGKKDKEQEVPVIEIKDFTLVDMEEKLNLLMVAINKINTNFHHKFEALNNKLNDPKKGIQAQLNGIYEVLNDEEDGVLPRMRELESENTEVLRRLEILEQSNEDLRDQVDLLRGTVQVLDKQQETMNKKVIDLTSRSMKNNILISSITGDEAKENCKEKVIDFIKTKLKMEIEDKEVIVAHRLGKKEVGKLRAIVVQCTHDLRQSVFQHTKNLKDVKNEYDQKYYVEPQLPEPIATERLENRQKYRDILRANEKLPEDKKVQAEMKNGKLYIGGEMQKKHIFPPSVRELFQIDNVTQCTIDALKNTQSTTSYEKSSEFIAYAFKVGNAVETRLAYKKFKQLSPEAYHIMMAHKVKQYSGHQDDGEHRAGKWLLNILEDRQSKDTAIFVARVYGGIPLGQKRFAFIEKAANEALNLL